VTKASNNIGTSRQWLSELKNLFEDKGKDPRKLEPESKDPHSTKNRKRISKEVEGKILKVRKDSKNVWGKVKVAVVLKRDYGIKIDPNTVNSYLHLFFMFHLRFLTHQKHSFYEPVDMYD